MDGAAVTQAVVRDQSGAGRAPKRPDIQGLRALAVIAVFANHLTGDPVGGFVGVDVFFVISGYLITGVLLRGLDPQRASVGYLTAFYRRRARRILPAAVVVIALTLLAAHSVFGTNRFATTRGDAWWSFIFWANWHFVDVRTNYFTASGPVSPFEHFWSLAVEEQFYFVWPLVTLLVASAVPERLRRASIATAAIVIGGVSLALAAAHSGSEPTTTYFSSVTRGWEIGVGALLACVPVIRASRTVLTAGSWAGTILIVVAMFGTAPAGAFPLTGVATACIGCALVIAAGGLRTAWNPLLTNWIAARVGDISYSLYLVHFPVIVLLAAAMSDHGAAFYASAVLLTLVRVMCAVRTRRATCARLELASSETRIARSPHARKRSGRQRAMGARRGGLRSCGAGDDRTAARPERSARQGIPGDQFADAANGDNAADAARGTAEADRDGVTGDDVSDAAPEHGRCDQWRLRVRTHHRVRAGRARAARFVHVRRGRHATHTHLHHRRLDLGGVRRSVQLRSSSRCPAGD